MSLQLRPYQQDGVAFLQERPRAFLGDELGLGKSAQLLHAARGRTLILASAMIHDGGVWEDEIAKWRPDLDATLVAYTSLPAREKTPKGGTRPLPKPRREYAGPWDTIICDEAHYLKGRDTTWTRAVQKLHRTTDRIYLATGTPIPNWAEDLFIPLQLLHEPGDRRFSSYWRWLQRWFKIYKPPYGGTKVSGLLACDRECRKQSVCEHWLEFHDANLGDLFLQRLRDDVLDDLPPLSQYTIEVDMVPAQRRAYEELKRDFIAWVEQTDREIVAWNTAAQATQLAKVTTGLEILDPDATGSGKLDRLRHLLQERTQPTLVVGHFRRTVGACADIGVDLGMRVAVVTGATPAKERRRVVQGFQAGEFDLMVGSLDVISEGLTLTRADMVIFVERSWRPSRNEQALRRIHRIGQTRPATAVHLISRDSSDERMSRVLSKKTDQQIRALRPRDLLEVL